MDFIFDPTRTSQYFTPERRIMTLLQPFPGTVKVLIYDRVYLDHKLWNTIYPIDIDGIKLFVLCTDIHRWEVWGFWNGVLNERLMELIGNAIEDYDD